MTKTAKRFTVFLLTLAVLFAFLPAFAKPALADEAHQVTLGDYTLKYWGSDKNPESVTITKYSGMEKDLVLPSHAIINGVKRQVTIVGENAFKGNTNLTSVVVPNGYESIGNGSFSDCPNLKEVTLGDSGSEFYYVTQDAFVNCPNLKTYRIGKQTSADDTTFIENVIGRDTSGNIMQGVTVYLIQGSKFDDQLKKENSTSTGNKLTLKYEANPAAKANVTKVIPGGGGTGEDGTPYGKGASAAAVEKAITSWSSEADPKGTVYSGLQAKLTKVTKSSLKLTWKKVGGAKKYVVYGNQCGTKNKYKKLTTTTKTAMTFKKLLGKKLKAGTYYKFMVVALDVKNKVVSSSKTVHAATLGGKVGNDKMVKTAAKKNKVALKKGKTFKLKAKAVPQSKKLKVKRHRVLKYETTNKKVATVNAKGIIKGTGKGSCFVYAYAQNGVAAKIKVTVK